MQRYYASVEALEQSINSLLTSDAWPGIAMVLRILLAVVVVRLLMLVLIGGRRSAQKSASGIIPGKRFLFVPLLVLFVFTLGHQASWQLFGQSRPKFVQFMQKYDRRQFNPAHSIQRGKLLD